MVLHVTDDRSFTIFLVHPVGTALDESFAVFEDISVVVADDITHLSLLDVRLDAQQVIESLIAFRRLRCLVLGQHLGKLSSEGVGVHHLSLRITWMHTDSLDDDLGTGGVEVLKLQFSHVTSVHRVSPFTTELLHIEMVGSHADLLIGIESDTDVSVTNLLMIAQPTHRLHNLCNARLVVGTKQRVSVSDDEILADMM